MLQQDRVRDALFLVIDLELEVLRVERQLRHAGHVLDVALGGSPVCQNAAAEEGVQLLLVRDVAFEVDLPRVALLLAHPLHQSGLIHKPSDLLLLLLKQSRRRQVASSLLIQFSLLGLNLLLLGNFGQLNLPEDLVPRLVGVPVLHPLSHLFHLALLLLLEHPVHSAQVLLMLLEHGVNILLVHFLEQLPLLLSQLPSEHLFSLPLEPLHMFGFFLPEHLIHIDQSLLPLHHLLLLLSHSFFKFLNPGLLLFVSEPLELVKLADSLVAGLL